MATKHLEMKIIAKEKFPKELKGESDDYEL